MWLYFQNINEGLGIIEEIIERSMDYFLGSAVIFSLLAELKTIVELGSARWKNVWGLRNPSDEH